MPRWYALCRGAGIPACVECRRFVDNNPRCADDPTQAWRSPDLIGRHCNAYIERPSHARAAVTPTDHR